MYPGLFDEGKDRDSPFNHDSPELVIDNPPMIWDEYQALEHV